MASIQDAVKMAQAQAQTMQQDAASAAPQGTQLEAYVAPSGVATVYSKPSMAAAAAQTGVIPRNLPYIKVNEFGIYVGKNTKDFLEKIPAVEISMIEDRGFAVKNTVRFGNPAQYISTYDGVTADKGGAWVDAVAKAKGIDPKADPYPAADVIVTLTEPLVLKAETIPAGAKLVYNTSKTAFNEWVDFFQAVAAAGALGQTVRANLLHKEIKHNGNTWGVVQFELLEG